MAAVAAVAADDMSQPPHIPNACGGLAPYMRVARRAGAYSDAAVSAVPCAAPAWPREAAAYVTAAGCDKGCCDMPPPRRVLRLALGRGGPGAISKMGPL